MVGVSALLWGTAVTPGELSGQVYPDTMVQPRAPSAVVSGKRPYSLVYDHAGGTVTLVRPDGDTVGDTLDVWRGPAGAAPLLEVAPDRPVEVVVRNANALLYHYDVDIESVGQKRIRMCRDVGRGFTLGGAGALAASFQAIDIQPPGPVPGFDGSWLTDRLSQIGEPGVRGVESLVTRATVSRTMDRVGTALDGYLEFTDRIETLGRTLEDSLATIAELADHRPLRPLLEALYQELEEDGLGDPARLPSVVRRRWQSVESEVRDLRYVAGAIRADRSEVRASDALGRDVLAYEDRILATGDASFADAVRQLQRQLIVLRTARQRSEQVFSFAPSTDYRRILIRLLPTSGYPNVFRAKEGYVELYTEAVVSVVCELSVGLSWLPSLPDYEVGPDDLVRDDAPDGTRTAALLGMSVSLSRLPLLGALLGVGVGGDGRPTLYLGGTGRLFSPVLVHGGWAWQYESTLPDGLAVGGPVGDPVLLDDLDRSYVRRLFFGISMALNW